MSLRKDFLLASQTMSTQSDGFTLLGRKRKTNNWGHWLSLISENLLWDKLACEISTAKKSDCFHGVYLVHSSGFISLSKWQVIQVEDILRTPCWYPIFYIIIDCIFCVLFIIHKHLLMPQVDVYILLWQDGNLCVGLLVSANFLTIFCLYKG